ncbi:glycosyl hydrolase family 18 protein [Streptomyces yokosukanensis]|uniref:glycosyl hydrolase family 18 protein n=1 Tax=Streptomyces yokosukanensis TaxID=67386 RepID=UPI003432BCA1
MPSTSPQRRRRALSRPVRIVLGAALAATAVACLPVADATTPASRATHQQGKAAAPALQAWIYPGSPGEPTCDAVREYRDGRLKNGVLKPEYWDVKSNGTLALQTSDLVPCNGYSAANASDVKAHSAEQYTTVSAMDRATVAALVNSPARRAAAVEQLTALVKRTGFTGVDIDFEDFWSWSAAEEKGYETFLAQLARSLHADGRKLQVDGPAELQDGDSPFSFAKVIKTGVDQLVIMDYGRQFNTDGAEHCWAIAPDKWVRDVVRYAQSQVPDKDKLVIGLPSYGYIAPDPCDTNKVQDTVPLSTISKQPGYSTDPAVVRSRREPGSHEVRWTRGGRIYDYTDRAGMDAKLSFFKGLGVTHVSVWALGGNPWFSR